MAVIKNVRIELQVTSSKHHDDGTMTVYFERPRGFSFEAGDWIDIAVPNASPKGGRTYSLSSSPTESELAISFRIGISPFKQHLQSLTPGDTVYITQYGNAYNFYRKDNRTSVLIAGGIGIAPFRSMLKEMIDSDDQNEVQLLYFNKGDLFLFRDEIEEWKKNLTLEAHYIETGKLKRKDRVKVFSNVMRKDADLYFIAGPEDMVETTEHLLIDMGIDVRNIRIDIFGGY